LFHCTTGKNRAGWASAALLPHLGPIFDRFESLGGDRELLLPVLGVVPDSLQAFIDAMRQQYGDAEGYFADGLDIDASIQAALRSKLHG
jgi:protein-tyrosine phosphatase